MINIAVVNTLSIGGAAIAKDRLVKALVETKRCQVSTISRFVEKDGTSIDTFRKPNDEISDNDVIFKYQRHLIATNRTKFTNTFFSGDAISWDISSLPAVQYADLINLHWVAEMINPGSLQRLSQTRKPIVWTLHDERAYTGGCHYTYGCSNYSNSCSSCPQVNKSLSWLPRLSLKNREKFREIPITFICPSRWIQKKLQKSIIFDQEIHSSYVIPYSLDLSTFKPFATNEKKSLKEKMNIPQDSLCLLTGCFSHIEDRKGESFLLNALRKLLEIRKHQRKKTEIVLLTYGKGDIDIDFMRTINLGFSKSEAEIAKFLNLGDLFLSMTREDNLPNTIIEALSCGTPVISTNVGGIPDMIEDGFNGRLVERDNFEEMANVVADSLKDKTTLQKWSINARKTAEIKFCHQKQGSAYLGVFENLLEAKLDRRKSSESGPFPEKPGITNRIPAIDSFPSEIYRDKAHSWFKKNCKKEEL